MTLPTLDQIFFARSEEETSEVLAQNLPPDDEVMGALKNDLRQHLPRLPWSSVEKEMSAKIRDALEVGVDDVLAGAWVKAPALWKYADAAAYPPEEVILVPLATHEIKSSHGPHVDLVVEDAVIGSLVLEVLLSLKVEGVVLKIQSARIREVQAGTCRISGALRLSLKSRVGNAEIARIDRKTPELDLAGTLRLGDGIPLSRRGAPGSAEAHDQRGATT